jgi:hypothetical protein
VKLCGLVLCVLLPIAGCTDNSNPYGDCQNHLESDQSFAMPADPPLQFRIESCKLDVDACTDLCTMVMQRSNLDGQETSCDVSFTSGSVSLKIYYDQYNPDAGCPIANEPGSTS